MKEYRFLIDQRQVNQLFSPIREKRDVIRLLMRSIKIFLVNSPPNEDDVKGEVVLHISKMSRVFFFSDKKYFSICLPFAVSEEDGSFNFFHSGLIDIDHRITSDVLSIIDDDNNFNMGCALQFVEPIIDISNRSPYFWELIISLLMMDDGYIRYDYDEERENGLVHPKNHYDIFYSSSSTFKIGLKDNLGKEDMIDFVRLETNCHFIE